MGSGQLQLQAADLARADLILLLRPGKERDATLIMHC